MYHYVTVFFGVEFQRDTSHYIESYEHAGTCDRLWTNAALAGGEEQGRDPGRQHGLSGSGRRIHDHRVQGHLLVNDLDLRSQSTAVNDLFTWGQRALSLPNIRFIFRWRLCSFFVAHGFTCFRLSVPHALYIAVVFVALLLFKVNRFFIGLCARSSYVVVWCLVRQ